MIEEGLDEDIDAPGDNPDMSLDDWPIEQPSTMVSPDAVRWADGCGILGYPSVAALPDDMRVWITPNAKRGNTNSAQRYARYQEAQTIGEIRAANDKEHGAKDLLWDLRKGLILLMPSHEQRGAGSDARTVVMTGHDCDHTSMELADHAQMIVQIMAEMQAQDVLMQEPDREAAEMARLEALEEFPPCHVNHSLQAEFPRGTRQTQAYIDGETSLRASVSADEDGHHNGPWDPSDVVPHHFGPAFDIEPTIAMVAGSGLSKGTDPRLVPPVSVAAARRLPNYEALHGWKGSHAQGSQAGGGIRGMGTGQIQ